MNRLDGSKSFLDLQRTLQRRVSFVGNLSCLEGRAVENRTTNRISWRVLNLLHPEGDFNRVVQRAIKFREETLSSLENPSIL